MPRLYNDSIIMDWQTGYGKLQTMLKIIQSCIIQEHDDNSGFYKTRLEIVGILLDRKQEHDGNFGFYKNSGSILFYDDSNSKHEQN